MATGIVETAQGSSRDREKEQQQQATRSRLVARLLAAAPALPDFLNDLITTQAVVVAGTEAAAFIIKRGEQSGFILETAAHVRPDNADEEIRQQALQAFKELVLPCVQQNKDGALELAPAVGNDEGQYCLVTLLRDDVNSVAVTAVITRCRDNERAQQRLVSMQLVAGYFDLYILRRKTEQSLQLAANHQDVLQYSTAVGGGESFVQSAANLCNALANRTGAVRVSLGWLRGTGIKVKALSHTEDWDKRQEVIQVIQKVMEEACDQDEPVYFNPTPEIGEPSSNNVTREAAAFGRAQGGNSVMTVPLRHQGELLGAITLEWAAKTPMTPAMSNGIAVAADVLAPQLEDRFQNSRWLIMKAARSSRLLGEKIIGPKYMVAKLVCSILLILALTLVFYSPMYRVSAPFQFSTSEKRVISAPFDGYLLDVGEIDGKRIRSGTEVPGGMMLARLDTAELTVQRAKSQSEALAFENQARQLRAERKAAQAQEAEKRAEASKALADFYDLQIKRASISAPIGGIVVKSEVDDRRGGGQVKAGETLFELAQIDKLRVELTVNERDVQMLKVGQKGEIATTSLPGQKYGFKVERIVPQGQAKDGANVFTVFGTLDEAVKESWRPGMAGEARVEIENKRLFFHWTHRFVDWVRLKLWI
jgi:biotin carboxyl carrier protein